MGIDMIDSYIKEDLKQKFLPDEYIFQEGEKGNKAYLLLDGRVAVEVNKKKVAEISEMEKEAPSFRTVVNSKGVFNMKQIPEGNYSLSFFLDSDGNNAYSHGNIDPYQPSEWFYIYPDTVKIRTNWDLELDQIKLEQIQ